MRCKTRIPTGRSKPARWRKTTRSEHGWEVAFPSRRRQATGQPAGGFREWTPWRAIRRRGDLWTIPREEARTTGPTEQRAGARPERGERAASQRSASKPEFEPQDRVASGKLARRSGGSSEHPLIRMRAPETMVLEGSEHARPRVIGGHGGQQRRPTSRNIVSSLPPPTKGLHAQAWGCAPRATAGESAWMGGWEATRRCQVTRRAPVEPERGRWNARRR